MANNESDISGGAVFGTIIAVLAGLALVGFAYYISENLNVLWALFFVLWMAQSIYRSRSQRRPLLQGFLALVGCITLGVIIWFSKNPVVLWAWFLVLWLVQSV